MPHFRCPVCPVPFLHVHQHGVAWVERNVDAAFRKALMDGVPVSLRGKMQRALAAVPNPARDMPHTVRYFGAELAAIADRVKPLAMALDRYLAASRNLPGLQDWMVLTGFTNHYQFVGVMNEWALLGSASASAAPAANARPADGVQDIPTRDPQPSSSPNATSA